MTALSSTTARTASRPPDRSLLRSKAIYREIDGVIFDLDEDGSLTIYTAPDEDGVRRVVMLSPEDTVALYLFIDGVDVAAAIAANDPSW